MPKTKKRKPDLRRIRTSKTYSLAEIAEALDRNIATVRRWHRDGLPALGDLRPPLVLGSELKMWLKAKWSARKQKCQLDELFCFKCRSPRQPEPGSVSIQPRNAKTLSIKAICSDCGTRMNQAGSWAKIAEIEEAFRTLTHQKQHLLRCSGTGAKGTSDEQGIDRPLHEHGKGQISMDFGKAASGKTL